MQLILAIDSDPRRSEQLANLVRARLSVDLVQATSAGEGLHALKERVPDLILTSPLLSPFDDGVLDEYLRDLGAAATHVQTVRIPMLSSGPKKKSAASRLFSLGRKKQQTSAAAPDGCDPKVFADEIAHYLTCSLEQRSSFAQATADKSSAKVGSQGDPTETALASGSHHPSYATAAVPTMTEVADEITLPVADEWDAPQALVEEFREPQAPIRAPEAVATVIEETQVPGSILDLRTPMVHVPEPPAVVEPEPLEMHPAVKAFLEPEPVIAQPDVPAIAKNEVVSTPAISTPPIAAPKPAAVSQTAATTGTSASFEAALAAIRAAWAKPEGTAPKPEGTASKPEAITSKPEATAKLDPKTPVAATGAKPLGASGEVDLTNEIDALEDVSGAGGTAPAAGDDDSPDESSTPNARRKTENPRKRPEKPRGRKTRGSDGRDDWGVLDPNQYELSALVNKLEEVTDSDEVATRATNSR